MAASPSSYGRASAGAAAGVGDGLEVGEFVGSGGCCIAFSLTRRKVDAPDAHLPVFLAHNVQRLKEMMPQNARIAKDDQINDDRDRERDRDAAAKAPIEFVQT